jgi:hypothetical protein
MTEQVAEMETNQILRAYRNEIQKGIRDQRIHWLIHRDLLSDILSIAGRWSSNEYNYFSSPQRSVEVRYAASDYSMKCVSLNIYLGPDDSIGKDAMLFIEEHIEPILEKHALEFYDEFENTEYEDYANKVFSYASRECVNGQRVYLNVKAYVKHSSMCRLVGTGEFKEKKKVVCDEQA